MNLPRLFLGMVVLFSALTSTVTGQSHAQTIRLGNDDDTVFQVLRSAGYTDPVVTSRSLTIVRTEACKGADKFLVKVSLLGRIVSTAKIGTCAVKQAERFTADQASKALAEAGFGQIDATEERGRVVATACTQDQAYRFTFSPRGEVLSREPLGRCGPPDLSGDQIAELLNRQGYERVVITDDRAPRYVAEACKAEDRVRIEMNRRGDVRSERRIGECGRQIEHNDIAAQLERAGYENVEMIEKRRPPYIAQACKGADKVEISIGRYGRITDERRIGSCRAPIDVADLPAFLGKSGFDRVRPIRTNRTPWLVEACKEQTLYELALNEFGETQRQDRVGRCAEPVTDETVKSNLAAKGYSNVTLTRARDGWQAEACRDDSKYSVGVDAFGDMIDERKIGQCQSLSVLEMVRALESRGATATSVFVEGCYAGNKYRWGFDRLGNRTDRQQIGGC